MYSRVWNEFVRTLETGNSEQQALKHMLKRQRDFLAGLRNVSEEVKSFAGILDFALILTPFSRQFMHRYNQLCTKARCLFSACCALTLIGMSSAPPWPHPRQPRQEDRASQGHLPGDAGIPVV